MSGKTSTKSWLQIIYGLYALSWLFGITAIVAIILDYVKKDDDDVAGTIHESHFRWQIRTFWFGLLYGVIGGVTATFLIGIPILIGAGIWMLYRIIKGWIYLYDDKPMYARTGFASAT